MAEGRRLKGGRLKGGRWRIYSEGEGSITRDPAMGTMLAFYSLAEAQRWWSERHPGDPPLKGAPRCARCGAYFGPSAEATALIATPHFRTEIAGIPPD